MQSVLQKFEKFLLSFKQIILQIMKIKRHSALHAI